MGLVTSLVSTHWASSREPEETLRQWRQMELALCRVWFQGSLCLFFWKTQRDESFCLYLHGSEFPQPRHSVFCI